MAAIDDKMSALNFAVTSTKPLEKIAQSITDAADLAGAGGGKLTITQKNPTTFTGVVKNFVRVAHGDFTLTVTDAPDGESRRVQFSVGDYMRVRDTMLAFIPVSPWSAPAYKPFRTFSEHLRQKL
ncbi:hypothetical protein [Microbacterium sp. Bi121]|uniref:hypothetical protein n=1 Tax=Microbacterium sp. Bi121 TaxID=2822348 RepID=UPI001DB7ED0D|nr:hypothetical protein [Microbacterium sp. Bi121]CAH0215360.1 hypothetical protein SRABI121_02834 [Microbacterium sp. Bi121]